MALEKELKYLLAEADWRRLLELARQEGRLLSTVEQTNHYLDTPGHRWASQGVLLRVRYKGQRATLTCKRQLTQEGPGQHCQETDLALGLEQARSILAQPSCLLGSSLAPLLAAQEAAPLPQGEPLVEIGALVTERSRVQSPSGAFVWELDRSTYLDRQDFELECEAEDLEQARGELEAHLAALGVQAQEGARPKVARLLTRAQEILQGPLA